MASGQMGEGHSLLLAFDTESKAFCRGFEAGHLWTRVRYGDLGPHTVHATNTEMVLRMAEACDLDVRSEIVDDCWMHVEFAHRDA